MTDKPTIRTYAERAKEYHERFTAAEPDRHLRAFLGRLPAQARVLDLGSGPGNAALAMQEAGHDVLALDATPAFVELAQSRGVNARLGTFDDVIEVDHYHGVWANFSLLHAPRSALPSYLSNLARALKRPGLFHIGMKLGIGEVRDKLQRFYAYYGEAELVGLVEEAGLRVTDRSFGEEAGLADDVSPWIILMAEKRA